MHAWTGSFFEQYPRHDTLISINKRHTGKTNVEFNMRHDWNSLVTDVDDDEAPRRFGAYSRQMFPRRQELVTYLNDFATKSHLKVVYDTDVTNITRISSDSSSSDDSARFTMTDQRQQIYNCRLLLLPFFVALHHHDHPDIVKFVFYLFVFWFVNKIITQEARLSPRSRVLLCVIEYFAKLLKIT